MNIPKEIFSYLNEFKLSANLTVARYVTCLALKPNYLI